MLTITKEFGFDAAHKLEKGYPGKCKINHGHHYILQVTVGLIEGAELTQYDMVMDFGDLKKVWQDKIEPLFDHQDLNETLGFQTTAENMVKFLFDEFSKNIDSESVKVVQIDLWETPTSRATYSKLTNPEYLSGTFKK